MVLAQARVPGREEVRPRRDVAVEEAGDGDPDRREAVQHRIAVGELQCAGARGTGLGRVALLGREEGVVGQREAQRPGVVGAGEDRDRGVVVAVGRGQVGVVPGQAGDRGVPGADGGGVGEVAAQGDRLLAGGDRVVEPVGEVQLDRERLEQVGLSLRGRATCGRASS